MSNASECDRDLALSWVFPTNFPKREYQLRICEVALTKNTLVCLPTGLGKTLIAAVVMYNYYRWFPLGKLVFMVKLAYNVHLKSILIRFLSEC